MGLGNRVIGLPFKVGPLTLKSKASGAIWASFRLDYAAPIIRAGFEGMYGLFWALQARALVGRTPEPKSSLPETVNKHRRGLDASVGQHRGCLEPLLVDYGFRTVGGPLPSESRSPIRCLSVLLFHNFASTHIVKSV